MIPSTRALVLFLCLGLGLGGCAATSRPVAPTVPRPESSADRQPRDVVADAFAEQAALARPRPPTAAPPRFVDGRQVRVRLEGPRAIAENDLRARLWADKNAREDGGAGPAILDLESVLQSDRDLVRAIYAERGFIQAEVAEPTVEPSRDGRYLDIRFRIVEGERFRLGRLRLDARDDAGQAVPLLAGVAPPNILRSEEGAPFDRSALQRDITAVTSRYRDAGHLWAWVDPETDVETARRFVHVSLHVNPGPIVHVERVEVRGHVLASPAAVIADARVQPGELGREATIAAVRDRLATFKGKPSLGFERGSREDLAVFVIDFGPR